MKKTKVYQFPIQVPDKTLAHAWHWREKQQLLTVFYSIDHSQTLTYSSQLTLVDIDVDTGQVQRTGHWLYRKGEVETLRVAYLSATDSWMVASLANDVVVSHVTLQEGEQEAVVRSLLDDPIDGPAMLGPVLALWEVQEQCVVIYMKPMPDFAREADIRLGKMDASSAGGSEPITIERADSALVCVQESQMLLMTLNPRPGARWGFEVSGYRASPFVCTWRRDLDLSLTEAPTFPLTSDNNLSQTGINARVIAGQWPEQSEQNSWIIGVTMVDIFPFPGSGYSSKDASMLPKRVSLLTWVDANGRELWRCQEQMGLCLQLCQAGSLLIGVDLLEGRWRLRVWQPQQQPSLLSFAYLDQHLQRIHLVAGTSTSHERRFWVLTESEAGIEVARYTFRDQDRMASRHWLPGVHFLEPQNGFGALNWHEEIDAFVQEQTLFLLCIDADHHLALYRIEEEMSTAV